MPGSRGGTSRSAEWRAKSKKRQDAIDKKYKERQQNREEPEEAQDLLDNVATEPPPTSSQQDAGPSTEKEQKDMVEELAESHEDTASSCSNNDAQVEISEGATQPQDSSSDLPTSDEDEDNSDSSSEEEDYEAYYLLEQRLEEENVDDPNANLLEQGLEEENVDDPNAIGPDPGDPHPGDPDHDDPDENDNAFWDSDDSEEENENFDLTDASLNAPLHVGRLRTKREALLLQLALSVRHSWDYESLINNMKAINFSLGRNNLPTNKKQLWRILHRNSSGIQFHAYCQHCYHYLGRKNELAVPLVCGGCGLNVDVRKVHCFVTLSLKKQLQNFLSKPGMIDLLQYRHGRVKRQERAIEDVYDSERYQNMMRNILADPMNFSYVLNTDGFSLGPKGHIKIWPVLIRLNELPPNLRQKFMFLAGIWVDTKMPNVNVYLAPIVRQLNRLATVGVNWTPPGRDIVVNSRFVPFSFTADAEGRSLFMNMQKWNGTFGCTFCLYVTINSKYPVPPQGQPWPADRTDEGMREDAGAVGLHDEHFRGHKGPTELMNLEYFDLRGSNSMDDLHPIYLGVAKFHTELLLNLPGNVERRLRIINHRLSQIRPPNKISRKPTPITKRGKWHGNDWRNWLLFYGPVCLVGLIPQYHLNHFQMLSHGVFLLSQDSILPEDTDRSDELLINYIRRFQEYHGPDNMRYNVHVLRHLVRSVRQNGNLWVYSTFNFESWNHRLLLFVTSPKDCMIQMTTRHLLCSLVYRCAYDEELDEDLRNFLQTLLLRNTHVNAHRVGRAVLLGTVRNRQPTVEEANLMQREEIPVQALRTYDRVIVGGAVYYDPQFNPDGRSDNTLLYTVNNTFCAVQSIATVTNGHGEEVCIVFVDELDISENLNPARHIGRVQVGQELPHIVAAESIISPAVRMFRAGEVYLVPLATVHEID